MCAFVCVYTCVRACVCVCVHACVCLRASMRVHVCVWGGGGATVSLKNEGLRVFTATSLHKLGLQRGPFSR